MIRGHFLKTIEVNHLHWIKDDGDEVFEGVGHDRDETIGALFLVNTASKATFTFDDIALDITTNADETFYVLADFGKKYALRRFGEFKY